MKAIKKVQPKKKSDSLKLTAKEFVTKLISLRSKTINNLRFFHDQNSSNKGLGIQMAKLFATAKQFDQMPLNELEKLLDNDYYEVRLGAVSIMDFQARDKKVSAERKKELFDLYIKRHDRINNWDLVDRSAPYVVGGYLFDKPRAILYKLAKSKNIWERRSAIVSTYFFIRQNEIEDTFKIAEILVNDKEDLINKAVGSWVREAGKRDPLRLIEFLDEYSVTMPRVTLRYAIEKLDKKHKNYYLNLAKN
jgi:3-methyladenine DNA glycosylase AlkD